MRPGAWRLWRSPPGQPGWARPLLLLVAAAAALAYAWGIGSVALEPFYGAAARSMSESWHNFVFAAFDPWGTVTVDKLPGALWVQALSLRIFGFHLWAIALPQAVEGTLTVLVLYRAVRRVAGTGAGLAAAGVLTISPVTVLLNRGNISDSLLILLLVLAADATTRALSTGRLTSLLLAGFWVGLAFQAKMLQAWLVLPALYLAYLIAAPAAPIARRAGHVALSALVVVVVSLSYMTAVSAVPSLDRPYVDGSCDNSLFSQVFLYNGLNRFDGTELAQTGCSTPSSFVREFYKEHPNLDVTYSVHSGWDRLLKGVFGRDDAWFLVPSAVSALALLLLRRRKPRTDALRASAVLWTTWLLSTGIFFSVGHYLNSYYLAALMPPMAALCGLGASVAWRLRQHAATRMIVVLTVVASSVYALTLLPTYAGLRPWIVSATVVVAALTTAVLGASLCRRRSIGWTTPVGLAAAAVALLLGSGWASATAIITGEGPFDTPYQPAGATYLSQTVPAHNRVGWPSLNFYANRFPRSQAVDVFETSLGISDEILATGREFLPVGGFTGEVPAPTLRQFIRDVARGRIVRVTVSAAPRTRNPDMIWVITHCEKQPYNLPAPTFTSSGTTFQRYICTADAAASVGQNP